MWNTGPLVWVLVMAVLAGSTPAPPPSCPPSCHCLTTPEGLHKAVCSSLSNLLIYSTINKRHNINILDLSHAGISKINGELDKFTEIVSIDLSSNKIAHLNTLPSGSKKLVHLNLAKNRLKRFSVRVLPTSISSLDLSHNMLHDVPTELNLLNDLEHLILKGNPLHCTCDNLKELIHLRNKGVVVDDVKCIAPMITKGASWNELKISEMCSEKKDIKDNMNENNLEDMMMGDQPMDTENFAENTEPKKLLPLTDLNDLDAGEVWEGSGGDDNDDEKVFLGVNEPTSEQPGAFEGSGDIESLNSNVSEFSAPLISDTNQSTTEEPGSGDFGSGLIRFRDNDSSYIDPLDEYDEGSGGNESLIYFSSTTEPFITSAAFNPFFLPGLEINTTTSEEPLELERPSVFQGKVDWDSDPTEKPSSTEATIIEEEFVKDTKNSNLESKLDSISDKSKVSMEKESQESKAPVRSAIGTYICVGILICLLVGLIGITIIRNQRRKKRDSKLARQQKKDVEKAGKEMVDMNKSLLGKPVISNEPEKKSNGNYELVPTHEPRKNNTNGTLDSKMADPENYQKSEAPEQLAQSPNTIKQNGSGNDRKPIADDDELPVNKSVTPTPESPRSNGRSYPDSHLLPPPNTYPDSNLLPPSSEYTPVYDSGRVRIKLTETPKPKTPLLINRSRSNAGDIIITPSPEPISPTKSTT